MAQKRLKPRLYLQVEDESHMRLFYSILSEDSVITLESGVPEPEHGQNGEIIYRFNFLETPGGPSTFDGLITGIPVTREEDRKIIVIASKSGEGVTTANDDGTGTMSSRDGDDK